MLNWNDRKRKNSPLTSIVFFPHTKEVDRARQLFGYPYSSKYLLLNTEKKIHTGLEQIEGEHIIIYILFIFELFF